MSISADTGSSPVFPGAVGLSGLEVYPWPTADGEHGGSPHLHLTCTEGYVVVGGRGRLETLGHNGHAVTELRPGDVVWFTPGTVHRAVNDGDLRVIVVMQNSGLPEAGDAVMTFPPEFLTPERYAQAASVLDENGRPSPERARARRDLAVQGFGALVRQWESGDRQAFADFCSAAADLVAPRLADWTRTVADGARAAADESLRQIDALSRGDLSHLSQSTVSRIQRPPDRNFGMCGLLHTYDGVRRSGNGVIRVAGPGPSTPDHQPAPASDKDDMPC
ncbi:cupin domain-containing protein [Streptomyces sp. NPDC057621]|uniref:cupin domain-containing protein n=1 Tax=Streptomyces sp. NPDC057621 TaxID=3346186 RepID=UPI003673D6B9